MRTPKTECERGDVTCRIAGYIPRTSDSFATQACTVAAALSSMDQTRQRGTARCIRHIERLFPPSPSLSQSCCVRSVPFAAHGLYLDATTRAASPTIRPLSPPPVTEKLKRKKKSGKRQSNRTYVSTLYVLQLPASWAQSPRLDRLPKSIA